MGPYDPDSGFRGVGPYDPDSGFRGVGPYDLDADFIDFTILSVQFSHCYFLLLSFLN